MTGSRAVLSVLAAGLLVALVLPVSETPASADSTVRAVFRFADDRVVESSGLVDLGTSMVTVNDSGDTGRVFVVDPASGRTVGVTSFGGDVVDVEALAPSGPDHVWVGDIGDNARTRPWIRAYRVPVAARQIDVPSPQAYYLNYPDGAHDAEAMVADVDGSLLVITKSAVGGKVYRSPTELSATSANKLELVGEVDEYVTDAALTEDRHHLLARSLGQASLFTYPDLALVTRFALPSQFQGEGVSLGPGDRLRLSSEGRRSAVLEIDLPGTEGEGPQDAPQGGTQLSSGPRATPLAADRNGPDWVLVTIPSVIVLGGLAIALSHRRSRRWS